MPTLFPVRSSDTHSTSIPSINVYRAFRSLQHTGNWVLSIVSLSFIREFLMVIRIPYSLLLNQKLVTLFICCSSSMLLLFFFSPCNPRVGSLRDFVVLSYTGDSNSLHNQTNCFHGIPSST